MTDIHREAERLADEIQGQVLARAAALMADEGPLSERAQLAFDAGAAAGYAATLLVLVERGLLELDTP